VLIVIVVAVMVPVVIAATPSYLFQLLTTLVRLPAVFAVALDCVAQPVLCPVNTSFTLFVSVVPVLRPCGKRRAHQSNDGEQCNGKNSDGTSHGFSFKWDCKT
jgi:hypothetical protein